MATDDKSRDILDNISECYLSLGGEGEIRDLNPRAEAVFKQSRKQLIGKNFWETFPSARGAPGFEEWHAAIDARVPAHVEGKSPVSDRWFEAHAYPDREGGTSIFFRDVTRRKRAEEALARSHQELERFTYIVSHDLQEPLRMVASYVTLLKRKYTENLDSRANEFIGFAVDGADRMKRLIQALLDYSRAARYKQEPKAVDLSLLCRAVVNNLKFGLAEVGAEVEIGKLPTLVVDASQMSQLLQHLLNNALKFRADRPLQITITARQRGLTEWQFSVSDNGIGFEPHYAERIFEIFQRLSREPDRGGTGIGLPICKKIVEEHGGRIWAEGSPGVGATFHFTLPEEPVI